MFNCRMPTYRMWYPANLASSFQVFNECELHILMVANLAYSFQYLNFAISLIVLNVFSFLFSAGV